jgi:DNA helicase-2/ATP-dependent DNA helicase PcrA
LIINPHDEEALKRIINVPARGIGKTTIDKLVVTSAEKDTSVWSVVDDPAANAAGLNAGTLGRINDFVTMIKSFRVKLKTVDAWELASQVAASTGFLRELYEDKTPEGLSRYENVQELLNGIREFTETGRSITPRGDEETSQETGRLRTLDLFMQDIALLTDADDEGEKDDDVVSLMTIHAAKGLEFRSVYVVGMEENLFPSQLSLDSREDLEEERRLFYVAITRAEDRLTLSYANSRYRWGNLVSNDPSRFLEEIAPEYLEESGPRPTRRPLPFEETPDRWDQRYDGKSSRTPTTIKSAGQRSVPAAPKPVPSKLKKVNSTDVRSFVGDDTSGIEAGMEVVHERFGKGKVLLVEGKAPDLKATVFFPGVGNKQLLLKFAKLRIVAN